MKLQNTATAVGFAVVVTLGLFNYLQRERHYKGTRDLGALYHEEHMAAITAVEEARFAQTSLHHQQELDVAITEMHDRWLGALTQNPELAEQWKSAEVSEGGADYTALIDVNRQLCSLALRHRMGFISDDRLGFVAGTLMKKPVVRQYWDLFGDWRTAETRDDHQHVRFHEILSGAAEDAVLIENVGA